MLRLATLVGMSRAEPNRRYLIEAVARALDVLRVLEPQGAALTLTDLAEKCGVSRSSMFRLLYTLENKGWVERVPGTRKYRRVGGRRKYRVGYAMESSQFAYSIDVTKGLLEAASRYGVDLLVRDNCYSAEVALLNAEAFVRERMDFVIECQVHERIAPVISHLLAAAGIPALAIDIPQPGAVFFGANNYQAGLIAGEALAEYAATHWGGRVDKLLLLELPDAGPIPQARMTGVVNKVVAVLGAPGPGDIIHVDCGGTLAGSYQVTRNLLRSLPRETKLLVAAINDPSAVGAVRALEEAGWAAQAAVVGHNATREARTELRKKNSCLIGSVGYFPEKYGEKIIPLVLKILEGAPVPPAVYVEHRLITAENLELYYPDSEPEETTPDAGETAQSYPPQLLAFL